jgi:hypothetical protein
MNFSGAGFIENEGSFLTGFAFFKGRILTPTQIPFIKLAESPSN